MHSEAHRQAAYDGAAELQAATLQMGVGNKFVAGLYGKRLEVIWRCFRAIEGNR